ncbi:MAG: phosphoglucosamine mutase [Deferribacteraceae bacterium]|jgi:phosphoglucosamine mutase|nr:phosphoglucosamine mutase [Deferribacteraceae bacterium]
MNKYFGTDGVRGKANIFPLTAEFALKLGLAAGERFIKEGRHPQIVIGKDTRLSCYMFEAALAAGICSKGVDAVLVGSIPTPAIAFMTRSIRACAGVVISASHNPYYDNGIKFFDATGYKLPDETETELSELADGDIPLSTEVIGKILRIETAVGRYVEFVKSSFDKSLDLRGFKIVVDCANGACYKVAPIAVSELGADAIVINASPNGTNINENAGSSSPQGMVQKVLETGADIGISFDGDGDRLIVCDKDGSIVDGDFIMGICAIDMKKRGLLNKDAVVGTVMSNIGFENSLARQGIKLERTQVGDRYVIENMRKNGYNLGGEQSGHLIFTEFTTTGDGLISALQLLKVIISRGKSLSELKRDIESYPQVLLNLMVAKKVPISQLNATEKLIKKVEKELNTAGRVLVRYSGTENKLRVMVEGRDADKINEYANDIIKSAEGELSLNNFAYSADI